jgi:hypothetical protein
MRRYVVVHEHGAVAIVLWVIFARVHDIAVHSPLLVLDSAEGDSWKTTTADVVQFLSPRAHSGAEPTGVTIYRFVDRVHPTLIIDDADKLLKRKPDLRRTSSMQVGPATRKSRAKDYAVTRIGSVRSARKSSLG